MFAKVVGADTKVRGVDKTVGIRMIRISTNSKVGGVGLRFGLTFGISIVSSAGDGLVGSIDTGGRFSQSVVGVRVVMSIVSSSEEKLRVGLGLGLGESGSDNDKQDLANDILGILFSIS